MSVSARIAAAFALAGVLALAAGAAAPRTKARSRKDAPAQKAEPSSELPPGHGAETRCEPCHQTSSWKEVSFDHDRTGFPLVASHQGAPCRGCHLGAFDDAIPRTCAGCHQDVHKGSLGQRCDGCHDPESWDAAFDAFAHRRTAFPLTGRHAFLPCNECHPGTAGKVFSGNTVPCAGCHADEWARAAASSVDHAALGFSMDCRGCHDAWRFERGRFPGHDRCFEISRGDHAGIPCLDCHSSLRGAGASGTCSTGTAACSSCHEHACGEMAEEHRGVPQFDCDDRACVRCHQMAVPSGALWR